ncbi:MAG: HNH endonuclease [Gemmatimonadaceae bacterium]|nr:HNH endonuclease [Gemmatimonadaceae bacterium]
MATSLSQRFWQKVNKTSDCWEWTGHRQPAGHGLIGRGGRGNGMALAHRVSWEFHYGEIPEGLKVCHHCDNGWCVRPDHLFLGTQADNLADMRAKGRAFIPPPGQDHPAARLLDEDVYAIRAADLSERGSQRRLAEKYGVSSTHIRWIRQRRQWTHLPERVA